MTFFQLCMLIGSFGVGKAAIYLIPRSDDGPGIRSAAVLLGVLNGLGIAAILGLSAWLVFPRVFADVSGLPLLYLMPAAVSLSIRATWDSFLRLDDRIAAVNAVALVFSGSFLASVFVLVWLASISVGAAVVSRTIAAILSTVVAMIYIGVRRSGLSIKQPRSPHIRPLLRYSGAYWFISSFQNITYDVDVLIVQSIRPSAEVGLYAVAVALAEILTLIPMAAGFILFPRASRGKSNRGETTSINAVILVLTTLGALLIFALGPNVVSLMYGKDYGESLGPLRALLPGVCMLVPYQVLSAHFLGSGRLRFLVILTGVGALTNVALNLLLVPHLGATGAGLASSISYGGIGVSMAVAFARSQQVSLTSLLPRPSHFRSLRD